MGRVRLRSWKQLLFMEVRRIFHVVAAQIAQRLCNAFVEEIESCGRKGVAWFTNLQHLLKSLPEARNFPHET